jgi:hypothetical protein
MRAPVGRTLTLILLIAAGVVLITGNRLRHGNDLSPAELAREVARLFRRGFRSRLPNG